MYIQLYQIKKHLNIDEAYHEDDEYLVDLEQVAEEVVEKHIDDDLKQIASSNSGVLPTGLTHAMLLFIGNMYANRESVAFVNSSEIPFTYQYLLDQYKNYGLNTTGGDQKVTTTTTTTTN
jgi:uncharacterized phage protein (predicted DNA packaging)